MRSGNPVYPLPCMYMYRSCCVTSHFLIVPDIYWISKFHIPCSKVRCFSVTGASPLLNPVFYEQIETCNDKSHH